MTLSDEPGTPGEEFVILMSSSLVSIHRSEWREIFDYFFEKVMRRNELKIDLNYALQTPPP